MGARQKLNSAYVSGAAVTGFFAGAAAGNPVVGIIVFAILVGLSVNSGDIRMNPRKVRRKN
jgi:hypothetical protein